MLPLEFGGKGKTALSFVSKAEPITGASAGNIHFSLNPKLGFLISFVLHRRIRTFGGQVKCPSGSNVLPERPIVYAGSKLASGKNTALWELSGVEGKVDVDLHCYLPMDRLLERQYGLKEIIFVGDRGMITKTVRKRLKMRPLPGPCRPPWEKISLVDRHGMPRLNWYWLPHCSPDGFSVLGRGHGLCRRPLHVDPGLASSSASAQDLVETHGDHYDSAHDNEFQGAINTLEIHNIAQ